MKSFESSYSKITVKNEKELSLGSKHKDLQEKREKLIPTVKEFISSHPLFSGKDVSVTFALNGVSSFVSILEFGEEKLVLKIPVGRNNAEHEGEFLNAWEKIGISVPHVIESGSIDDRSYILMKYIDAPVLSEAFDEQQMLEQKKYYEMGQVLRKMHEPQAEGYGNLEVDRKPHVSFQEWVSNDYMQGKFKYVKEHGLLSEEHGSLDEAINRLTEHTEKDTSVSYCHGDFAAPNIFATEPITVFDPYPNVNNRYIDLGRSLVLELARGGSQATLDQMIEGYFEGEDYDKEVLDAAMLLNTYQKFQYWHQKGKTERIENLQKYLLEN